MSEFMIMCAAIEYENAILKKLVDELQTNKVEIQSNNYKLQAENAELKAKNADLIHKRDKYSKSRKIICVDCGGITSTIPSAHKTHMRTTKHERAVLCKPINSEDEQYEDALIDD